MVVILRGPPSPAAAASAEVLAERLLLVFRRGGEIASNRRDEQEIFVLCPRILQSALVYMNTLMLQDALDEPEWAALLTPADSWSQVGRLRGLVTYGLAVWTTP